jgi:hypothetical protein
MSATFMAWRRVWRTRREVLPSALVAPNQRLKLYLQSARQDQRPTSRHGTWNVTKIGVPSPMLRDVADVQVWSEYEPHLRFVEQCPIRRIRPWRLAFPRGGTLVFVGTYFRVGHRVRMARADRAVILYK